MSWTSGNQQDNVQNIYADLVQGQSRRGLKGMFHVKKRTEEKGVFVKGLEWVQDENKTSKAIQIVFTKADLRIIKVAHVSFPRVSIWRRKPSFVGSFGMDFKHLQQQVLA